MDTPYQNREIDEKFGDIQASLDRIETQTIATNGRVRWLEKMIWASGGFCMCVTIVLLPLLFSLIQNGKL